MKHTRTPLFRRTLGFGTFLALIGFLSLSAKGASTHNPICSAGETLNKNSCSCQTALPAPPPPPPPTQAKQCPKNTCCCSGSTINTCSKSCMDKHLEPVNCGIDSFKAYYVYPKKEHVACSDNSAWTTFAAPNQYYGKQ